MDARPSLARLDEIAAALAASGHALALLALGSCGLETDRFDAASDLDFFALVEPGHKRRYIERLDWLAAAAPIAWHYRNTVDGHKLLYEDGVFCEFAVFEPAELPTIPYAPGRIVWQCSAEFAACAVPVRPLPVPGDAGTDWLLGEVLTNLYAGLCRLQRGEVLSATRSIQVHALERTLELAERALGAGPARRDPFNAERRLEQRVPALAAWLPRFAPGYAGNRTAAAAQLEFLRAHHVLPPAMDRRLRTLIGDRG